MAVEQTPGPMTFWKRQYMAVEPTPAANGPITLHTGTDPTSLFEKLPPKAREIYRGLKQRSDDLYALTARRGKRQAGPFRTLRGGATAREIIGKGAGRVGVARRRYPRRRR